MRVDIENRVLGSLYAMASGDAMGVPSSFLTPEEIKENWGWIDTFLPPNKGHRFHDGLHAGEYTDDTEQALALVKAFCTSHRIIPEDVAREIMLWAERVKDKYVSPLGPSTERALKAIKAGADIAESGKYGNTNGSAMRISPVGLIHGILDLSLDALCRDVYQTCIPTHNTTLCVSASSAIAAAVSYAVKGKEMREIIDYSILAAEIGSHFGHPIVGADIATRIRHAVDIVYSAPSRDVAMERLYAYYGGGDGAADSIPTAIAIFALADGQVKDSVEIAANLGGDADTNGAMAGAIAGAYSGFDDVPDEWVRTIEDVNHPDMRSFAKMIIASADGWHHAGA